MGCIEQCWTPVRCEHGREMTPRGRSASPEVYVSCECYMELTNPRHLWHEHDDTRWYTDPDGWNAHAASCEREDCREWGTR